MTEAGRWADMAAAFALDALDPDERDAFEVQLQHDPELRRLVDQYRETLGVVGAGLASDSAPASLRGRILERAQGEGAAAPATGTVPVEGTARPAPDATSDARRLERRTRGPSAGLRLAVAAGIVGLLALGATALVFGNRANELGVRVSALESELAAVRAELGAAEVDLARLDSISSAFVGSDIEFATLASPGTDPRLNLVRNRDEGLLLVAAVNLPPAPADRVYQLWGINEGENPVSLGLFNSDPGGSVLRTLALPGDQAFAVSAVTEEPASGSPQPTTEPFLVGTWSAGDA